MIEKLKEPNENTRKYLAFNSPDILAVWDKINEIIEDINEKEKRENKNSEDIITGGNPIEIEDIKQKLYVNN